MKAQILKIAGVKNEKEFYKKFPTEEAFMKKHGKELKKAQVGAMIGQQEKPQQAFKPIAYNNLENQTSAAFQGITPEELTRRKAIEDAKVAAGGGNQGGGLMDGLGQLVGKLDPEMISSLVGGAKNGKKLKKAQTGGVLGAPFQGMPKTPTKFSVPSTGGFDTSVANNPNLSGSLIGGQKAQASSGSWAANPYIDSPFKASQAKPDTGFDWQGLAGKVAPVVGGLIGDFTKIQENEKNIDKQEMYGKVSDKVREAASTRTEQAQRRYVRPEDQAMQNLNPLGRGTNYLAARNGTEIQNTYNPGDLYSDLGYEPLTNPNQVKQYKKGGKMKKAQGGVNLDPFAGIAGSIGGAIGSKIGGGSGKGGPGSSIGSTIGGIAGSFIPIPGVGTALGALAGGAIGGLFDSGQQNREQAAQDKLNDNLFASSFQSGAQGIQSQNASFMKDGGYVSNDWTPQVITTFGEHKLKDLLQPPHDADMLRAGGHLRYYTPPSAEAMYTGRRMDEGGVMHSTNMMFDTDRNPRAQDGAQMAMGGDLHVGRGKAETMSYNPYLPDQGETIMFRGPSHENGGMPVSFGQNGVEVEGGEPAIKMQDGGKSDNLVVFGNMVIPEYGANEIEDPKAKGKKFKHYVADLSKQEAKINKSIEKGVKLVNTKDSDDPFDQLAFNSGQAMIMGGNKKLQTIAQRKMNAAAVQNGILEAAEEHGLKSDELAKGKIKMDKDNNMYAEFGKKLSIAQNGKKVKYDPEFENFITQAMMLEQDNSSLEQGKDTRGGVYRGGAYNYGTGEADRGIYNTPEKAKEFYYKNYWPLVKDLPAGLRTRALQMAINTGDPYGELLIAGKQMTPEERIKAVKEVDKLGVKGVSKNKAIQSLRFKESKDKIQKVVEEYKKDPQAFLSNLDAEQNRYYDSIVKHNDFGADPNTVREFFDDYVGLARYASQPYIPKAVAQEAAKTPAAKAATSVTTTPTSAAKEVSPYAPVPGDPYAGLKQLWIPEESPSAFIPNLDAKIAEARKRAEIDRQIAERESRPEEYLDEVKVVAPKIKLEKKLPLLPVKQYSINPPPLPTLPTLQDEISSVLPSNPGAPKPTKTPSNWWDAATMAMMSAAPFLRPSSDQPLDPATLAPEMMALANNTLEPVPAQGFNPLLSQPISISLQDQLNEVTAQTRAAERMAAYNPEAASMIAAGAYNAKNKILGEQFRLNQAEQQRVAEQNRNVLNDAMLKNLAIFDTQFERQAQAKSNTKQQAMEAMKSVADKIAKNKLENRTLAVYENQFPAYSFTKSGTAYKNPAYLNFFNTMGGFGDKTAGLLGGKGLAKNKALSFNAAGEIIGLHSTAKDDDTSRNGSIVKAIKNL